MKVAGMWHPRACDLPNGNRYVVVKLFWAREIGEEGLWRDNMVNLRQDSF